MFRRIIKAVRAYFVVTDKAPEWANLTADDFKAQTMKALLQWETAILKLHCSGVIDSASAAIEIDHLRRLRRDTLAAYDRVDLDAAGFVVVPTGVEVEWRPGAEHHQPHPVKENPDGTLYYRGSVYRKIGDHAGRKRRTDA